MFLNGELRKVHYQEPDRCSNAASRMVAESNNSGSEQGCPNKMGELILPQVLVQVRGRDAI